MTATATVKEYRLDRTTFRTSRLLDFCSEKELTAQTGHGPEDWPLVVLKEATESSPRAVQGLRR